MLAEYFNYEGTIMPTPPHHNQPSPVPLEQGLDIVVAWLMAQAEANPCRDRPSPPLSAIALHALPTDENGTAPDSDATLALL